MIGDAVESEVKCTQTIQPVLCNKCGKVITKNFSIKIGDIVVHKKDSAGENYTFTLKASRSLLSDAKVEAKGFLCEDCMRKLSNDFKAAVYDLLKKYKMENLDLAPSNLGNIIINQPISTFTDQKKDK